MLPEEQLLLLQTTLSVQATKTDPMLHSHPVVQAVQFSIKEANIIVTNMLKKWNGDPTFDVFDNIDTESKHPHLIHHNTKGKHQCFV